MKIVKNEQELDFQRKEVTKGTSKGRAFLGIDVTSENFGQVSQFFGADTIVSWVNQKVRQLCLNANSDAEDANGQVDPDKFARSIVNARITSASLAELREEQAALIAEFIGMAGQLATEEGRLRASEIQTKLAELNELMEERKRKPRVTEEEPEVAAPVKA